MCLCQPLVETEEYKEATKGIKNMAREELLMVLQNVLDVLKGKAEKVIHLCMLSLLFEISSMNFVVYSYNPVSVL